MPHLDSQLSVSRPDSAQIRSAEPPSIGEKEDGGTLLLYWNILARARWELIAFVALVTMAVMFYLIHLPKKYEAIAVVRVDPSGVRIVGDSDMGQRGEVDARTLVLTESKVITSPAVIQQTIDTLHLDRVPEFMPKSKRQLTAEQRRQEVLQRVSEAVTVVQPIETLLLDIHVRAYSPDLAAEMANGIAQAFLDHEYSTRAAMLSRSSQYMVRQLNSLRVKMEQSQADVIAYSQKYNIEDPDSRNNVLQARLTHINDELAKAQTTRIQLESEDNLARHGRFDDLMVTDRGSQLQPLQRRLIEDQRKFDEMSQIYGPHHPLLVQEQRILTHDQDVLTQTEKDVRSQIGAEYNVASDREKLLKQALIAQKAAIDQFELRAIQYRALAANADSLAKLYYSLQQRIQQANLSAGFRSENLRLINPAQPNDTPVAPRVWLTTFLVFLGSALFGAVVVVGLALNDDRVSSPEQIDMWFHLATLGTLPQVPSSENAGRAAALQAFRDSGSDGLDGTVALRRRSPFWEAIMTLQSTIQFIGLPQPAVVAITSPLPGEGKSTIAANLACALALGGKTILVDADLRKPSLHRILGVPSNRVGLSSVLRQQEQLHRAIQSTPIEGLSILSSGPIADAPAELVGQHLAGVIEQLRASYDYILLDCPPTIGFSDALSVANMADGVLVVVTASRTRREILRGCIRQLKAARANILGVVLNRIGGSNSVYYYGSHYSTYYNQEEADVDLGRGEE